MSIPTEVTLTQLREGLAFLGVPLEHVTEITITPDMVRVSGVVLSPSGAITAVADGKLATFAHEIPVVIK